MNPVKLRTALLIPLAPLVLAGCYTVLSHPRPTSQLGGGTSGSSGSAEGEALSAEQIASLDQDCLRCHVHQAGGHLDPAGAYWSEPLRLGYLDPRWPSSYSPWIGYMPDRWQIYYRDRFWWDPWPYYDSVGYYDYYHSRTWRNPWYRPDHPHGGYGYGGYGHGGYGSGSHTSGPPPETGTRHLWQRPVNTGSGGNKTVTVRGGTTGDSAGGQPATEQGSGRTRRIRRPDPPPPEQINEPPTQHQEPPRQGNQGQSQPGPKPRKKETGKRHLWGRRP